MRFDKISLDLLAKFGILFVEAFHDNGKPVERQGRKAKGPS
jgi:hypothetical protein